ncbi:RNA polymerase sigma factor [Chitinophaga qingshengii]|uniref:Sigma-70 family RNA polymerase sigma factor n=1 Tax=Chitinophaga qingshengii TaxID=1569794 RepID=A0ABR7TI71_9BACT|nr:sigma-70 family RNA polymerase sigma factor [Chitinophaga qingshengii]MBC9929157.1 sigma-70 family RNA polymerase sigma factor [Chitinophaga qingshengii]
MPEPLLYNENDLLSRIARGEEQAFTLFVRAHWNTIFSHAIAYLKTVEKAEEVTQDIFMRLWKTREKLGSVKSLKDYLFIVARNQIYNEARKKIQQLYIPSDDLEADAATPDQYTEYRLTYQLLLKGVELLPEQRKKVFTMSRFGGMSNEQIAAALGMHKDTVYQYLAKAVSFLKVYMKEHSSDPILLIILFGGLS